MQPQTTEGEGPNTKELLQSLSKYYREVLKYVSSSASRVLQNIAIGQKYGLVADLSQLIKDKELLKGTTIVVKKPKKEIKNTIFKDEDTDQIDDSDEVLEDVQITDEDIAWAAVNKIWRNQENNPYERETLIGEYVVKANANKKAFFAPLLIHQVEILYDPTTNNFSITKLSDKPDLNRGLIANLLPDDTLIPVRNKINEVFLEAEESSPELIEAIIQLLGNNLQNFRDIQVFHECKSVNELVALDSKTFTANTSILINTPKTGSFVLDDLDLLSQIEDDISNTPIEDLLTVNFKETDSQDSESNNNLKQEHYFFPLKHNIHQKRVCDQAMSQNLTVVWGPPGTGKSETISNLICHLIANGKTVLVTSQQSKAIEVVKEKLRKNISLPAPKHPELTVPLELSLIRGQKESTIADDIRQKLEALSVYTLGINSSFEITQELDKLKRELNENKEKILALEKRFAELKINERKRYVSNKDTPMKLHELRAFNVINTNETFQSNDTNVNKNLLQSYLQIVCSLKDDIKVLANNNNSRQKIEVNLSTLEKAKSVLITIMSLAKSKNYNPSLIHELANISNDKEIVLQYLALLTKYRDTLLTFVKYNPNTKDQIDILTKISKLSIQDYEEMTNLIMNNQIKLESIVHLHELLPLCSNTENSISDLENNLEIIKRSNINVFTKYFDKRAVEAHSYVSSIFNIRNIDKRAKKIIIQKFEELIELKRMSLKIETLRDGLEKFDLIPKRHINIHNFKILSELTNNYLSLHCFYSELKDLELDQHFAVSCERTETGENRTANEYMQAVVVLENEQKDLIGGLNISDWSDQKLISDSLYKLNNLATKLELYKNYVITVEKLSSLPISLKNIEMILSQSDYTIPEKLSDLEKVIECHRLFRLYGNFEEETPNMVAKRIKSIEAQNKEHIHKYILFTRLKALHWASKSKLANSNLVKLRHLLSRKKKTLAFLKKKDSIDFAQVLHYFPCWIVSIDDVSRYFPIQKGLFDYVIVDESSQCSQTAIPHLFYRAKKAIIVGDEKQLPSASLRFLQKGIMDSLQRKYDLHMHTKSSFFDCKEFSLLTFAQSATPPIPLIEHFRCDPTIIEWSNKNVYNNMMKIMTPIWENRFNPPMEVRYVSSGSEDTEEKINQIEAKEVLRVLKELTIDRAMQGLSIGVISPFRQQADYISDLIYREIAAAEISKFGIQSRTVDGFQGDERDVILYSMRFAPNGKPGSITAIEGGVNEEGFKRMNVAFTRARRKVIIFTSQKINEFPGKLIKSFMTHAKQVQDTYSDPLQPKDDQFDSQFEQDVCTMLRGKGFNVVTQFQCGGYRIDQVVYDKDGRTLALECDGDFKMDDTGDLPPEHYQRQATIERITQWNVERLTASVFYRDPVKAIDQIIDVLLQQSTKVEKNIEQYPIEDIQETQKTSTAGDEIKDILEIVEDSPKTKIVTKKEKGVANTSQQELFTLSLPANLFTEKNHWFALSHWGKTTGKLSTFENRFCYSLGVYLSKNDTLTEKQKAFGEKIAVKATKNEYLFTKLK